MVEDQADFGMSRSVMAAFAACHADACAGGRRLRVVSIFGIALADFNAMVRSQDDRRHSDTICAGVYADFASRCACVQVRSRACLQVCCWCVCAVGCGRSACCDCARQSGCDNHALIRSGRVGVWQWLIKCARPHNATVTRVNACLDVRRQRSYCLQRCHGCR